MLGQTVGRTIPRPRVCVFHPLPTSAVGGAREPPKGFPLGIPSVCSPRHPRPWAQVPSMRFLLAETRCTDRASVRSALARSHWLPKLLSAWAATRKKPFVFSVGIAKGSRRLPFADYQGVAKELGCGDFPLCATLGQMTPSVAFAVRIRQRSNRQSVLVAHLRRLRWSFALSN